MLGGNGQCNTPGEWSTRPAKTAPQDKKTKRRGQRKRRHKEKKNKKKRKTKKKRRGHRRESLSVAEEAPGYWRAVKHGRMAELQSVLRREGSDPCLSRDHYGWQGLHYAAYRGDCPMVRTLLHYRAPVNTTTLSAEGATPLHFAILNEHTETALILCENGADSTVPNAQGITPEHMGLQRILEAARESRDKEELRKIQLELENSEAEDDYLMDEAEWAEKLAQEWGWENALHRDEAAYSYTGHYCGPRDTLTTSMTDTEYAAYIYSELSKKSSYRHYPKAPRPARESPHVQSEASGAKQKRTQAPRMQENTFGEERGASRIEREEALVHERRWEDFVQAINEEKKEHFSGPRRKLAEGDIPFPSLSRSSCMGTFDVGDPSLSTKEKMRAVMRLYMRWHPDRFMHRYGAHIRPDQVDKVTQRVTKVAQHISQLKELVAAQVEQEEEEEEGKEGEQS